MNISWNWLTEYFNAKVDVDEAAQILTDCGLEVEAIVKKGGIKGNLSGLIVGEILSCKKHPNADRLMVTSVTVGNADLLQIICGAPNVEVGQKVIIAPIGTTIFPHNGESIQIKKAKIRGETSMGMICAEDEIGLSNVHDGIVVLNNKAIVGKPVKDLLNENTDTILEIGLTPNRSDAISHIGVARDLVAVMRLDRKAEFVKPKITNFSVGKQENKISVSIENSELCSRYSGVTISGITVKESPEWLQQRLLSVGLNPINNVVDSTNFVMHELGQPLHAFDAKKIRGNKIIVKKPHQDISFVTLDGMKRTISTEDLMIYNESEAMCIAGVFGGIHSGVTEKTNEIFIESACFNPISIRKTAKRHGMNTDSSFRFERGTDPNATIFALKRAAVLITEIAGGQVTSEIIDIYPHVHKGYKVILQYLNCDRLTGVKIDREIIKQILTSLEISIITENEKGLQLLVPPFKVDVQREADVIEEVIRIYGYNNISIPDNFRTSISYSGRADKTEEINQKTSDYLAANGFHEIIGNSLTNPAYYKNSVSAKELVTIKNPLSHDLETMRQTLLFNSLEVLIYNRNRSTKDLKLFELGFCYGKVKTKYEESLQLGMCIAGNERNESWHEKQKASSFYSLKGNVDAALENVGITSFKIEDLKEKSGIFDYGLTYLLNEKTLVTFGSVASPILHSFDIKNPVYFAEFNWDIIQDIVLNSKTIYRKIPKFPSMRRDLALLIDNSTSFLEIEKLALEVGNPLLKEVNLFDVYRGKGIESAKKSYAVSFTFQDETRTLTDDLVDSSMKKLLSAFKTSFGAKLR